MSERTLIAPSLWLIACVVRWRIARHYCEPFRFMGPKLISEAWQLLDELGQRRAWLIRLAFVAVTLAALVATIWIG